MNSVDDTDSMALSIAVERYAGGRMETQEEQEFEVRMLERPELAAQVAAAQRMRVALRQLQASGELESLMRPSPTRWAQPTRWLPYALAAGIALLAVGTATLMVQRQHRRVLVGPLSASLALLPANGASHNPAVDTLILAHTRSGHPAPLSLGVGHLPVLLEIFPETPSPSGDYRVTLWRVPEDAAGRNVSDIPMKSAPDGSVGVLLDPSRLTPGDYQIALRHPISATEPQHEERFALHISADVKQ